MGSLRRETFKLLCWYNQHSGAWPLNFCNSSPAICVSSVKTWVCYSQRVLKAGNRTVREEFTVVTIEEVKVRYTTPTNTNSRWLLWRQLVKTVKAWFTYTERPCCAGLQRQGKKKGKHSIMPLLRLPWCWSPLMLILPPFGWWEQCLLAHTAAALEGSSDKPPQHLVFLAGKDIQKANKCGAHHQYHAYLMHK